LEVSRYTEAPDGPNDTWYFPIRNTPQLVGHPIRLTGRIYYKHGTLYFEDVEGKATISHGIVSHEQLADTKVTIRDSQCNASNTLTGGYVAVLVEVKILARKRNMAPADPIETFRISVVLKE